MATKHKILILAQEEEQIGKFNMKMAEDHLDCCIFKTSHFESFQEGKRVDKFDMVIMWVPEADEGEIEMSEEFYKHYAIAPVCGWYSKCGDQIKEMFKSDFVFQQPSDN